MYVQPRVVGYASFQATARTAAVLPAGKRQRRFSTSSTGIPNLSVPSKPWSGGFWRDESNTYYQNVYDAPNPLSDEDTSLISPITLRHLSDAVSMAQTLAQSNPWHRTTTSKGGSSRSKHFHMVRRQSSLPNENVFSAFPSATRIQVLASHKSQQKQSETSMPHRSARHCKIQQPRQHAVFHQTHSRDNRPSRHVSRFNSHQLARPKFSRQPVDFSKYQSSARIATHFLSDRFPIIKRDEIQPFVYRVLRLTCDHPNIMYGALLLLQRLKVMKIKWKPSEVIYFPCYIFLCAYLVARKFILDEWVQNKALFHAMELPFNVRALNCLERSFIKGLDYNLTIDSTLLSRFSKKIKNDFLLPNGQYPSYSWNMVSKTDPRADRLCV